MNKSNTSTEKLITKTEVRLAVIEEKVDNVLTEIKDIKDNKADKWVEQIVKDIDKKLDKFVYWFIGLLITIIGLAATIIIFQFRLKMGWI